MHCMNPPQVSSENPFEIQQICQKLIDFSFQLIPTIMNYKVIDEDFKLVGGIARTLESPQTTVDRHLKLLAKHCSCLTAVLPTCHPTCYIWRLSNSRHNFYLSQALTSFIGHFSVILMAYMKARIVPQHFLFLASNMCCRCHRQSQPWAALSS